ncbi:hypothetical protein PRIPAC_93711 [Pristionchus pacificus]|uniref:Uncharacterized protein n=1 Tax=Pristionchus pacificus TaxID=54126 RepID=A0A2A6CHM5_PRIPA|nr:hypothetical protein PRIPAC_93711 [Pristionchus pacificus]|eukprot:PDM77521.1 hypothetical protein PRIPAC_34388 [Pristionchus pacificus]
MPKDDPTSYMDQYAVQVVEFMKTCFPNVRGRGRPMHGRTSPISPSSPSTRRNISNPLFFGAPSLFPQGPPGANGLANSPISLLLGNARNNNMLMDGRLLGLRGPIGLPPPMVKGVLSKMLKVDRLVPNVI